MRAQLSRAWSTTTGAQTAVGAAGAVGLTAAAVAQYWLHQGWVIWLWIGGGALSLWLLARRDSASSHSRW